MDKYEVINNVLMQSLSNGVLICSRAAEVSQLCVYQYVTGLKACRLIHDPEKDWTTITAKRVCQSRKVKVAKR